MEGRLLKNLKPQLTLALEKVSRYVYYINLIALILVGFWLYFFYQQYFVEVSQDVQYIEENLSDITYVQLNQQKSIEIYASYEKKREAKNINLKDLSIPF